MSLVESAPIAASSAESPPPSPLPSTYRDYRETDDRGQPPRAREPNQQQQQRTSNAQQDYSVVMLVKTAGSLIGAPVMTLAWVKGIGWGGAALGLPYFVSAVSFPTAPFFRFGLVCVIQCGMVVLIFFFGWGARRSCTSVRLL